MGKCLDFILSLYPDFFDKREGSNFTKLTNIFLINKIEVRNCIRHLQEDIHLFDSLLKDRPVNLKLYKGMSDQLKDQNFAEIDTQSPLLPIFIHTTQTKDYETYFHFVCIVKNIKSVTIKEANAKGKFEKIIFKDLHVSKLNGPFYYVYFDSDQDQIISKKKFRFEVDTHDDYYYVAESGVINSNIDAIGKLWNVPRRKYVPVKKEDYENTVPPYCIDKVESDYNYVCRLYEAIQDYRTDPLPVWHLWNKYGIESELVNRKHMICRIGRTYVFRNANNVNIINKFDSYSKEKGDYLFVKSFAVDNEGNRINGKFGIYIRMGTDFRFYGDAEEGVYIEYESDFQICTRFFASSEKFPKKDSILEKTVPVSKISEISVIKEENYDYYVSNHDDYNTIVDALKDCFFGESIFINEGEHTESLKDGVLVVGTSCRLRGKCTVLKGVDEICIEPKTSLSLKGISKKQKYINNVIYINNGIHNMYVEDF